MVEDTNAKILKALAERKAKNGSLPDALQLYQKLLAIQTEAKKRVDVSWLSMSREAINERITQGRPLLGLNDLHLDWGLLQSVMGQVTEVFSGSSDATDDTHNKLNSISPDLLQAAISAWFTGKPLPQHFSGFEEVAEVVLHAALKPFLSRCAEVLINQVNQENWRRGYCPICGGSPDLAYLDKERGARWLMCSRCDAQWLFQRLECPDCGNQNQNELAYFTDDKGLYRLYVCERCRCYLKAIDLRHVGEGDEVLLPLERFVTLDMDRQAIQNGYVVCSQTRKQETKSEAVPTK